MNETAHVDTGAPREVGEAGRAGTPRGGTPPDRRRSTWGGRLLGCCRALRRPGPWRRGLLLAALALLIGLLMTFHGEVPDHGGLGSLVETFLPWCGLPVPVLCAAALWRRSASAVAALVLPVVAWLSLFGGLLVPKSVEGADLTVVSHNVGAQNTDPAGTARALSTSGADLLALEELEPRVAATYEKALAARFPHHVVVGTVGLWSRLPLSDTRAVDVLRGDVGPLALTRAPEDVPVEPARALRATVATEQGPLAVYVAHLGSVRLMPRGGFWTDSRDAGAAKLTKAVAAERVDRALVLGDMNGTLDDRVFEGLGEQLRSAQEEAGDGFGFSWPASFPMARIDQILVRGVEVRGAWTLPRTGSDHLPVAAGITW
ncbi:endonuclease/exonuclease/phosphatase family protein [Streptomyces sp. bgisy091]|uniref:endonuclease/exonuclease/phosphatase family protein n=1 Tax=Streptomyces sp. bgisy091 TaxID=3413778 RepID=UPI003D73C654